MTKDPLLPEPDVPEPPRPESRYRRPMAISAALLAGAIFVLAVGLLWWRSGQQQVPTSVVEVQGTEAFAGTLVRLEGVGMARPHEALLSASNLHRVRIYVDGGYYTLVVQAPNQKPWRRQFDLPEKHMVRFELAKVMPWVAPATTQSASPTHGR